MNDDPSRPAFEVDTDTLNDVLQAVGVEEVGEFVRGVDADMRNLIEHLNAGGGPEALDAVGREAHHLSGGCRSLGFLSIGAVCAQIEADARERTDQKWPSYAVELGRQQQALSDWWSNVRRS